MKKLILLALTAAVLLTAAAFLRAPHANTDDRGQDVVMLNEIAQLAEAGQNAEVIEKAAEMQNMIRQRSAEQKDSRIWVMCGICLLFLGGVTGYCCIAVLRPFEKLTHFADEIASGNFDLPLDYERSNYFGKFTWGFDRMRREISNARACEQAAIENHKTVIASLSHDIKTPVASVRAYAEALEMGMAQTPEQREEYLNMMMRKCDEITKLTDDMLLHALSDLGRLRMQPKQFDLAELTEETVRTLSAGVSDVHFKKPLFPADVYADPNRIAQVLENLIHNARKYAKTDIAISMTRSADFIALHVCDTGGGIPDADLPFVCEQFYRGHNTKKEAGAGLGLYIVKYIAEQSGGDVMLQNRNGGLEVTVNIPVAAN
ncbi:MAG TPA: sensor histidine kinase [Ruminococcus sp.]|nr:sensor histidine kinase [Ruminococcus sp.]